MNAQDIFWREVEFLESVETGALSLCDLFWWGYTDVSRFWKFAFELLYQLTSLRKKVPWGDTLSLLLRSHWKHFTQHTYRDRPQDHTDPAGRPWDSEKRLMTGINQIIGRQGILCPLQIFPWPLQPTVLTIVGCIQVSWNSTGPSCICFPASVSWNTDGNPQKCDFYGSFN